MDRVTLEMSIKPFISLETEAIAGVCREAFRQWMPLCRLAKEVSMLLWVGDGQGIYLWRGNMEDHIAWARYIGFCNPGMGLYRPGHAESQPVRIYRDNPVSLTYAKLREIIRQLRLTAEDLDLKLRVGATIDPGPEFVENDFRYSGHPELTAAGPETYPGTVAMYAMLPEDVYLTGKVAMPPPNPPWGSNDPGLEMAAMMSSAAHLPGEHFLCRLYINDPWFYTNPWMDYYNREPYDIYLPLSISRLQRDGKPATADRLALLTIDTEKGHLVENTATESFIYMRRMLEHAPDAAGICTWLYPYREYHRLAADNPQEIGRAYFADAFMADAINNGLPLNTVVSTDILSALSEGEWTGLPDTIIVAPTPLSKDAEYEELLSKWLERGGRAILYGPLDAASSDLRRRLGIKLGEGAQGEFVLHSELQEDPMQALWPVDTLYHRAALSGGPVQEIADGGNVLVTARSHGRDYAYAVMADQQLAWIRGSTASAGRFLHRLDPEEASACSPQKDYLPTARYMRHLLSGFGYTFRQLLFDGNSLPIVQAVVRHDNAFYLNGHKPDATVRLACRFPEGVPMLTERETRIVDGLGSYALDRSFNLEARVFIEQQDSTLLTCKERQHPTGTSRRLMMKGLKRANVLIYPAAAAVDKGEVWLALNDRPMLKEKEYRLDRQRKCLSMKDISGFIEVTW